MRRALRDFPFSRNGYTVEYARKGEPCDIPANLVRGLEGEGYIEPLGKTKDAGPSPEDKMMPALENKHPLDGDGDGRPGGSLPASERDVCDDLRAEYEAVTGERADMRWGERRLRQEIAKAKG